MQSRRLNHWDNLAIDEFGRVRHDSKSESLFVYNKSLLEVHNNVRYLLKQRERVLESLTESKLNLFSKTVDIERFTFKLTLF